MYVCKKFGEKRKRKPRKKTKKTAHDAEVGNKSLK